MPAFVISASRLVFLCMLAYYVKWHMRRALAPCYLMTLIQGPLSPNALPSLLPPRVLPGSSKAPLQT